ncbi:MAG: transcriptional regulator with XRE-family HTH domain [Hyphomicrobiaceae bacterium]|jgi:transcriptional regulator with XRE-family HTH domain
MTASDNSPGRAQAINRIRLALIEKKMTQAELADAADCHEKTIQNLLAGRTVRDQTMFDVCMVLDLDFDELKNDWSGEGPPGPPLRDEPGVPGAGTEIAPVYMGAYTHAAVDHLIGSYLTIRPAFTIPNMIIAYRTDITWDASWPSLLFEERNRPDAPYSHRGRLHVPPSSSFIHLVSLTKGAMRMIVVSQLDQTHMMRGLVTTLAKKGVIVAPASAPIVYQRINFDEEAVFGEISPDNDAFSAYQATLRQSIDDGYCSIISI